MGAHADMKFVLFLDASEEAMIQRITKRGEEAGDNKRNDDNLEVLQKRFTTFHEQSVPIIQYYEGLKKVQKIDANQNPDKVYQDVLIAFKNYI